MDASASSNSINPNSFLQQASNNPVAFLQSVDQLLETFGPEGVADASSERFLKQFGESLKQIINDSDLPQSVKDAANNIIDSHTGGSSCDPSCAAAVDNSEVAETVDCLCEEAAAEVENECACSESTQSPEADTEAAAEADNEGGTTAPSSAEAEAEAAAEAGNEGTGGAEGGPSPDDLVNELAGSGGSGSSERRGNWLEILASTLATVQSTFLDKALTAADTMADQANAVSESGEGKSEEFLKAQASFTANMQLFTIFSNQVSTGIKSIGEALAGISRKQ